MRTLVTQLIEDTARLEAEEAQARQIEQKQVITEAERVIDEFIAQLGDREVGKLHYNLDRSRLVSASKKVVLDGLLPFWVFAEYARNWSDNETGSAWVATVRSHLDAPYIRNEFYSVATTDRQELGRFLKNRQEGYDEQQAQRRQELEKQNKQQATELLRPITKTAEWDDFEADLDKAEALLTQAKALWPKLDVDKIRADYLKERTEHFEILEQRQQAKQEAAARQKAYDQAKEGYKDTYAAWFDQREITYQYNLEKLPALLVSFNRPFTVYRLTFSLVANDGEEEERYLDTKNVWCIYPQQGDYHKVIHKYGDKVEQIRYANEVSRTAPETVTPLDHEAGFKVDVSGYTGNDDCVYYSPEQGRAEVKATIKSVFLTVPNPPNVPEILGYNDAGTIEGKIINGDPNYTYDPYYTNW